MRNLDINKQVPATKKKSNIGEVIPSIKGDAFLDTGETQHIKTEDYKDYLGGEDKGASAFPFMSDYNAARALGQSNWEQAGKGVLTGIMKVPFELAGQIGSLLDFEDYANSDNEVGNWLTNWTNEQKQGIDEALPIYQENPNKSLQTGDFAWWMQNGSDLLSSAVSFAALGYGTGALSLAALTKGAQATKWLQTLGKTAQIGNQGKNAVQGLSTLSNAALLNHAEGYGIAVNVYKETLDKELNRGKSEEEAKQEAARKAENAINANKLNILLNLSSASLFLKAPKLTRKLLKSPNVKRSLKRAGLEGLQESAEEVVNLGAEKAALSDEYDIDAITKSVFNKEGLEAALLGFIGGAAQTGFTLAGRDLKLRRDSDGTRISDNQILERNLQNQEEAIRNWEGLSKAEKVSSVTDAFNNFYEQNKLYKEYGEGDEATKNKIKDKLLYTQAYNAFDSGTTEQLLGVYEGFKSLTPEEAEAKGLDPKTYQDRATNAIELINSLEREYIESREYLNPEQVYNNRAELVSLRKDSESLIEVRKDLENRIITDLTALGVEEPSDIKAHKEQVKELGYAKELSALTELIKDRTERIKELTKEYATITSDNYQKQVKTAYKEAYEARRKEDAKRKKAHEKQAESNKKNKIKKKAKETVDTAKVKEEEVTEPVTDTPLSISFPQNKDIEKNVNDLLSSKEYTKSQKVTMLYERQKQMENLPDENNELAGFKIQLGDVIRKLAQQVVDEKAQQESTDAQEQIRNNKLEEFGNKLEDFAPLEENRDKTKNLVDSMFDVFSELESEGVDTNNFVEVGTYLRNYFGKDRFIKFYPKFRAVYNLVSEKPVNETYEELFLDLEESQQLIKEDDVLANSKIPSQLHGMFQDELLQEIDNIHTQTLKNQGYTRYADENVELDVNKAKLATADDKVAHLDKKYSEFAKSKKTDRFNILGFELNKEDIDNKINQNTDSRLLDYREIKEGSKVTFVPLNQVVYDDGTIVYRDGRIEKDGKITKENPLMVAPIGMEYNGTLVKGAFLHVPDWITQDKVRGNVAEQKENLIKIRKAVLDSVDGIQTTITQRGDGFPLIDINGFTNLTKDTMNDASIGVGKDDAIYGTKTSKLLNDSNYIQNGRLYTVYPVSNNKKGFSPLQGMPLTEKPVYITSMLRAVEVYLNNYQASPIANKIQEETGIDLRTLNGLGEYFNLFVYAPYLPQKWEEFREKVSTVSDKYPLLQFTNYNMFFSIGDNNGDTARYIDRERINSLPFEQREPAIKETLAKLEKVLNRNLTINASLDKLGKSFKLPIINKDKVDIQTFDNYNDFIKEHSYTANYSVKLDNGNTIYTVQSTLAFDTNAFFNQDVPKTIENEVTDSADINEKVNNEGIQVNENDDLTTEEDFNPKELTEQEYEEYRMSNPDVLSIKGLPISLQETLVNHVYSEVIKGYVKDKNASSILYIGEFLNTLTNVIRPSYEKLLEKDIAKYQPQLDVVNSIIDNYTIIEKLAIEKLQTVNNLVLDNKTIKEINVALDSDNLNIQELSQTEEAEYENWQADRVFKEDYRNKISVDVKNIFSYIPDIDPKTGKERKTIFNITKIVPLETVINDVAAITAYNNNQLEDFAAPDFDVLLDLIEAQIPNKPYLKNVVNELKKADSQTKNKFVRAMSKHYTHHEYGLRTENGDLIFLQSDRNNIENIIINEWLNGLLLAPIIKEENGVFIINDIEVDKLADDIESIGNKLKKGEGFDIKEVVSVFDRLGLGFNEELVGKLNEGINVANKTRRLLQLFKDSDGLVKLYINRLKTLKGKSLQEENPFNDLGTLKQYARALSRLYPNYYANSFKDVRGLNYWGYSQNKLLIDRLKELKTNPILHKRLKEQPFTAQSFMLSQMLKDDNLKYYTYNTLDGESSYNQGRKFQDLSKAEQEAFKLQLFYSKNKYNKKKDDKFIIKTFYPTTSDKSVIYTMQSVGFDIRPYTINGQVSNGTLDLLYSNIVKPELLRILDAQANPDKYDYKGLKEGSKMFMLLPELNTLPELVDRETGEVKDIRINKEAELVVKEFLKAYITDLAENRVAKWRDYDFIHTDISTDGKGNEVKKESLTFSPRRGDYNLVQEAFNYEVNYLLFNMGVFQLFTTDPALYWKSSHWKTVSKELDLNATSRESVLPYYNFMDWMQEHKDSFDNMGKRLAADVAPGEDLANSENESFNVAHVADNIISSDFDRYFKHLLSDKDAAAYTKMNATDAQEFTTLEEHLNIMLGAGEISKTQKTALLQREKADSLTSEDFKLIFGEGKALNPHKLRYSLNIWRDGIERRVYIKSSSFPLIKQLTNGLEIDKLRESMLSKKIDRVVYDSAFKIGGKTEPLQAFFNDGTVSDNIDSILDANRIDNLPRNGHKIQQQVPYKENKSEITNPTQLVALITSSVRLVKGFKALGKTMTGKDVQDEIDSRYVELYKTKLDQLVSELDYNFETQTFDINKLRDILRAEGIKRGYSLYDLMAFNVKDGKFEIPLWATGVSSKIQSLLNSIVDNRIRKHKPRGMSNVLGSSHGFSPQIIEGENAEKIINTNTGIVFDKNWLENSDGKLRPMRKDSDGKILPAEVIAPFRLYDEDGNKLNIRDYVNSDNTLDVNKLPDNIRELLGFRIPTQGLKSMSYIKIVGFVPETLGDLILAPSEFTVQMGSDFDVDKLYSMMYHTKVVNGNITKLIEGDKLKVLDNELLDLYMSILKNPSEQVQQQILAPLDFGMLLDVANEIYTEGTISGISEEYQSFKYNNAKEGKIGVGVFSNDMRLMANLADKGIAWINKKGQPINFSIGGKISTPLSYPYTKGGRLKSNVIEAYQSLSVDNENEQGMHKLNINQDTFSFIRAMAVSGFEEDIISYILAQPIIKDYINYKQSARDGSSSLKNYEIDSRIKETYPSVKDNNPNAIDLVFNTGISKKNLIDSITGEIDNEQQRKIYALFTYLDKKGKQLQDIQSSINTFNKGIGKNLFYSFAKEKQLLGLLSYTNEYANLFSLVGDYISLGTKNPISTLSEGNNQKAFNEWAKAVANNKQGEFVDAMINNGWYPIGKVKDVVDGKERYRSNVDFIKPKTVAGLAMVNGTLFNNQLWEDLFPYNSVSLINTIERVKLIRNIKRPSLIQDSEISESIFNSIKSYLSTKAVATITDGELASERSRLLLNTKTNNSLAHIIKDLRDKGKYKNTFLNRLDLTLRTSKAPSMINYKAGVAETLYEREIYQSFNSMLQSTKELGTYNGIKYTPRLLAQDLITYSFVTGGIQGATQFIKYIPINYLKTLGFYEELEKGLTNKIDSDIVAEQTIQHNPRLVYYPSIIDNGEYERSKDKKTLTLISTKKPLYISIPEQNTTKGFLLYKNDGKDNYYQISTLGYKDFLEYNYNVNEARSILPINNPSDVAVKVTVPSKRQSQDFYKIADKLDESGEVIYTPNNYNIERTYNLASNNIPAILQAIANNVKTPTHVVMLQAIMNNKKAMNALNNTRLIIDNNLRVKGSFNYNDNTIKLNPSEFTTGEDFEATFLEEVIHAITKQAILSNSNGEVLRLKGLLNEAEAAVKKYYKNQGEDWQAKFIAMQDKLDKQQPLTKEELDIIYPIYNVEEFVGRLFKSKKLQEILNDIPSNTDGISLWQKFKDFIAQLLNYFGLDIKKGSVLDYSLSDILSLIATATPSTTVQAELKRQNPINRTIEFVEDKYNLRDRDGNLLDIANPKEVADAINSDLSNLAASVIGNKVHIKYIDGPDFSPASTISSADSFKRNINRRIKFIQDSIDKASAAKDYKRVEILRQRLDSIRDRAESLKTVSSLTPLIAQGKQDMEHLKQLFDRGLTVNDAIYIKEITDYWTNLDQLLFTEDDRYSDSMKAFKEIEVKARQFQDRLHQVEENYVNDILKKHGKQTTVDEIFEYYKDINYLAGNTLDISRYDNPILNNLLIELKEANNDAFDDTNKLLKDLNQKEKELDDALKSLGYTGDDRFNIFRQQDDKGRFTNHLVQRYNLDFLLDRGRFLKSLRNKENTSNISKYKSFLAWARENTYQLDLSLLFNSNDVGARNTYIAKLKEDLGDKHFEEVFNEQKTKINRYKEQYKNFQDLLLERHGLANYKDLLNNETTKKAILSWTSQNSPFAYQKHLKSGLTLSEGNLKRFRNTDYLTLVQKDKDKYDENFAVIENNEVLSSFHKYFIEVDKQLQNLLPEKERLNLIYYGIPYLPYTTQNLFRQKGYKAGLAPIYDAVQRSIRIKGEGKEDINPITDRPYRSIDVSLTKDTYNELQEYLTNKNIEYELEHGNKASTEQLEEWKKDKIHELSQKNSFDLPAVLRMYALTVNMYSHKAKVEDYMRLIQNIFDRKKEIRRNAKNDIITKDNGEPDIKEASNSFKNTKASLNYLSETFYGISKKNEGVTSKKSYTSEEKIRLAALEESSNKLDILFKAGTITGEEYSNRKDNIEALKEAIGGIKVWSRVGDGLLKYVQLKGMGWNFMSSIANVGFGFISNYVEAAGGLYYSRKSLNKAYSMVRYSMLRNASFNRFGGQALKIRAMMDKWDVLKDASKELFTNPFDVQLSDKHKWLAPYNLVQRTEYINQAPLMIALLLDKKLENGVTYWEALDENGQWKEEYGAEPVEEMNKLRLKLDQLIKANHGNYDPVSSLMIKDKFLGRAMSQFRTWMFEGVANRVEKRKYDDLLEDERKGRYRSYGDFFSENGIQGILYLTKGFIRSATLGKVFNGNNFSDMDRLDAANMRKNMAELVMLMNIYMGYLLMHSIAAGLDDEDDRFAKYTMNTLINQGIRLKTDILFYVNPNEFKSLMRDLIPVTSLISDTASWLDAVGRLVKGEDTIESGVYAGHSRLLRETVQMLPFGSQIYKNINYSIQTFED